MAVAPHLAEEQPVAEGKGGPEKRGGRKRQASPDAAVDAKLPPIAPHGSAQARQGPAARGCALVSPAAISMLLLALQFGLQPVLSRSFVPRAAPKMAVVWATEAVKIMLCMACLLLEDRKTRASIFKTWSLRESLRLAAFPAACYAVQNVLAQVGYQHLDSLTFNLLNQTKTISAAVCLFVLLGKRQSLLQLVALAMLLAASVILNYPPSSGSGGSSSLTSSHAFTLGVLPVLGASFLSGLSAALTQSALQGQRRNSYLLSMELAVYGQVFLIATLASKQLPSLLSNLSGASPPTSNATSGSLGLGVAGIKGGLGSGLGLGFGSGEALPLSLWRLLQSTCGGLFEGWTAWTLIPVVTNAAGGIVVGLVTKYAGGVAKGFALIGGILITAFAQAITQAQVPPPLHWLAAALVGLSTYLHAKYPPAHAPAPLAPSKQKAL